MGLLLPTWCDLFVHISVCFHTGLDLKHVLGQGSQIWGRKPRELGE